MQINLPIRYPDKNEIHNVSIEIEKNIPLYGYKGAYQIAFCKLGIGAELIAFTSNINDDEILDRLSVENFDGNEDWIVRFSCNNEINLPRAFDLKTKEDVIDFIKRARKPGYAILVGRAGKIKNAYEVYIKNSVMYICILPGKWEVTTSEPTDIIIIDDESTSIYRYTLCRKVKGRDDISEVPPFDFKELEDRANYFESLKYVFEKLQINGEPTFARCTEDFDGNIFFFNMRKSSDFEFFEGPILSYNDFHIIQTIKDLESWDKNKPILFQVTSEREQSSSIYEIAKELLRRDIKQIYTNSVLSHQAIILRELGFDVRQNSANFDIKVKLYENLSKKSMTSNLRDALIAKQSIRIPQKIELVLVPLLALHIPGTIMDLGTKAFNLKVLASHKFRIQDGFVVKSSVIKKSLKLKETIGVVENYLDEYFPDCDRFIVRSSSILEDGDDLSYAGSFCSEINVPKKDIWESLIKVATSRNRDTYGRQEISDDDSGLAIIIQKMLDMTAGGVAFSRNILSTSPIQGSLIQAVWGQCDSLTSGSMQGELYLVEQDYQNYYFYPHRQNTKLSIDLMGRLVEEPLSKIESRLHVLDNSTLIKLARDLSAMEKIFKKPLDVEFGILNETEVVYLQARPISQRQAQRIKE